MQIYQINTTAFKEEDLFLLTDLTEDQITEVVNPLVMAERDGYEEYNNEILVEALEKRYPKNTIKMFAEFVYLTY
jgi:hypothetical protein